MTILIVILAALNAYAPTSMDIYLPAFPQIAEELDANRRARHQSKRISRETGARSAGPGVNSNV
jgi:hypothetical protein